MQSRYAVVMLAALLALAGCGESGLAPAAHDDFYRLLQGNTLVFNIIDSGVRFDQRWTVSSDTSIEVESENETFTYSYRRLEPDVGLMTIILTPQRNCPWEYRLAFTTRTTGDAEGTDPDDCIVSSDGRFRIE